MKRFVLIVALSCMGSSAALADAVGPVQFEPPWPSYPGKAPGSMYQDPDSSAQIVVEGPYEMSAEDAAGASWPKGGKVEDQTELTVAGQPGYLVVRKKGKQRIASAAVVVDGAAYVFSLVAKKGDYDATVDTWGAMVGAAWVSYDGGGGGGGGEYWEPTYEQPSYDGGGGERTYSVTAQNNETDCSSTVTIDGQSYTLAPGDSKEVQLTAGYHTVGWQNRDGTSDSGSYEVPDLSSFGVSCAAGKKPKKGQSASREEAESDNGGGGGNTGGGGGTGYSADELQGAAYVWVRLYYTCLNFMSYSDLFGDGKAFTITGIQDRMAKAASENQDIANMLFAAAGSEQDLVDKWNNGDENVHYQLMRSAAQFSLDVAGDSGLANIWGDHGCAGADDPIGCWVDSAVDAANRYYQAKENADKQEMTRAMMIESSTSTFIFNNMMNSMMPSLPSW